MIGVERSVRTGLRFKDAQSGDDHREESVKQGRVRLVHLLQQSVVDDTHTTKPSQLCLARVLCTTSKCKNITLKRTDASH